MYSNTREDLVARLTTSSYYTGFKDRFGKASSVVGAPTLEQFAQSYNAVNTPTIEINSNSSGYQLKFSDSKSYTKILTIPANAKKIDLYVRPSNESIRGVWLASFSSVGEKMIGVTSGRMCGEFTLNGYDVALRPLVKLNSNVKLIDPDGDGIYDLQ